jgi:hypothetical protein
VAGRGRILEARQDPALLARELLRPIPSHIPSNHPAIAEKDPHMKSITSGIAVALALLALGGCDNDNTDKNRNGSSTPTTGGTSSGSTSGPSGTNASGSGGATTPSTGGTGTGTTGSGGTGTGTGTGSGTGGAPGSGTGTGR